MLAASKNQADDEILASNEKQADGKILAANESQADGKILAAVEMAVCTILPLISPQHAPPSAGRLFSIKDGSTGSEHTACHSVFCLII
jgi:hypothetical protein